MSMSAYTHLMVRSTTNANRVCVHNHSLFGNNAVGIGYTGNDVRGFAPAINVWRLPINASLPEHEILEALDQIPRRASCHNLGKIFENLASLLPNC